MRSISKRMWIMAGLLWLGMVAGPALNADVGLWLFDEGADVTAFDQGGDADMDMTLRNGATWTTDTPFIYPGNHALLLDGVNDTRRHAAELVRLLHGIRCRVNLIPYNHGPVAQFAPSRGAEAFREMITDRGMIATVRTSRGQDIQAACGMLSTARRGAANTSQSC